MAAAGKGGPVTKRYKALAERSYKMWVLRRLSTNEVVLQTQGRDADEAAERMLVHRHAQGWDTDDFMLEERD